LPPGRDTFDPAKCHKEEGFKTAVTSHVAGGELRQVAVEGVFAHERVPDVVTYPVVKAFCDVVRVPLVACDLTCQTLEKGCEKYVRGSLTEIVIETGFINGSD